MQVVTRSPDRAAAFAAAGFEPIIADVTRPETLVDLPPADTVLFAVGYDRRQSLSIGAVYAGGLKNVLAALPSGTGRMIYLSSTGVYGNVQGDWVDETSECVPQRAGG